jgi:2-hydroxychromene-2-carboxylate isomerase
MAAIEYFDSAHSAYAYLGSRLFMEIARVARRSITHRPMDLAAVVVVPAPGSTTGACPSDAPFSRDARSCRVTSFSGR